MRKLLIPLLLLCYDNTLQAQIYRWVDEDGTVHFSDSPPPGDSAQEVQLRGQPSQQAVRQAQEDLATRLHDQRTDTESREQRAATQRREQEQEEQRIAELQNQCAQARQQLELLGMQLPVYREDNGGERAYLDDDARAAEIASLKEQIARHCE